jgi:hypothetical protein
LYFPHISYTLAQQAFVDGNGMHATLDSPNHVFVALCIVVIVDVTDIQDGLFFALTRARTFKLVYPQGSECCLGIALFPNF